MSMRSLGKALLCAFFVLAASQSAAFSQTLKIGIVDSEIILKQLPEAKDADTRLNEIITKYRDTLNLMEKDFTDGLASYEKQKGMMTPDAKTKEEERLMGIRQRYAQYQEEKFGAQGEVAQIREKYLSPLRSKIDEAIKAVAKEESLSLVMDKASPGILYVEEKYDVTFKVLDRMKRGNK